MDRQTIIQWAREADIDFAEYTGVSGRSHITTCGSQTIEKIEALAKLVAEHEREQCAQVCEKFAPTTTPTWVSYAAQIRARGEA
jgi:hydroxymethylpyrimidine/phosphomethylpyrimidine kinase